MYVFGHLAWGVLQPGNLLLLVLLAGVLLRRRRLVAAAALGLLVLAATPVPALLLRPLETRFPPPARLPDRIDGILVLGGAVDPHLSRDLGTTVPGSSGSRVMAAILLAIKHPEARLALIGGEGDLIQAGLPEARASLPYILQQGVPAARVALEEASRSTHENAIFARAQLHPQAGENWVLVTSAWHMPRSVAAFRAAGWRVIPYPVDFRGASLTPGFGLLDGVEAATIALKEWVGLAWYRLLGWTNELFPAPAG